MTPSRATIQVGLVGFGIAGRYFHAPVINAVSGLRLAAIVQRSGNTAAETCPDLHVVRSVEDLLAIDEIGLVVVATPNTTHAVIARRCLEAGRHVIIDKPIATTSSEAGPLIELARQAGRLLGVYHNRRWDGDFLTIRRLLADGACGRPVMFESHFDRYRPGLRPAAWRERAEPGSGVLFNLGSHLVDQAVALFGLPEAVTADVRLEREGAAADDAFDVMLHYPQMRALLRGTMLACQPGPRFVLHGTDGTYVKHHVDPQEERLKGGETAGAAGWGEEPPERWGVLTRCPHGEVIREPVATEAGDYRRYYENIRDAIHGRATLAVTPEQALDVVRLLEVAQESSRHRRTLTVK